MSYTMKNMKVLSFIFIFFSTLVYSLSQVVKTKQFFRAAKHYMPHFFSQHSTASAIQCCDMCLAHDDCQSVNYNHVTGSCQFVPQPLLAVSPLSISDSSWCVFSKKDWFLVFVGLAGNGVDVYASYLNGISTVTDDVNCMTLNMTACQQNYRSPVMNSWSSLSITEVKYSLYKNDVEVAYAMFNGTGSNITNWFSQQRLLESSWTEALTTLSFSSFSMEGFCYSRRFTIEVYRWNCSSALHFTATISNPFPIFCCNFDLSLPVPQFLYSTAASPSNFESGVSTDYADYMAIYIR